MKILILNSSIDDSNFLATQLRINNLFNLYIKQTTYKTYLQKNLHFYTTADHCINTRVDNYSDILECLPVQVKEHGGKIDILYYDMRFFPIDIDKLNMIACPEENTYRMGYISAEQLSTLAETIVQNKYRIYLKDLLKEQRDELHSYGDVDICTSTIHSG